MEQVVLTEDLDQGKASLQEVDGTPPRKVQLTALVCGEDFAKRLAAKALAKKNQREWQGRLGKAFDELARGSADP